MRRGRFLILIALLLVLTLAGVFIAVALSGGLPAVFGLNRGIGVAGTPVPANGETPIPVTATPEPVLNILAAGQNLQRGAVIPTEAIIAIPWPTSMVPPSAITNPVSIVGTRARYTIARGEPIFTTMIVQSLLQLSPTGSDAAAQIPPGFVGISIPYSRTNGVALGIKDGDHVNVIVSWAIVDIDQQFQTILPNRSTVLNPPNPDGSLALAPSVVAVVNEGGAAPNPTGRGEVGVNTNESFYVIPSENQRPRLVTQGIIQDALVLHVGDFGPDKPTVVEPTPTAVAGATASAPPPPTAPPPPPDILTLVVSPQDSLVLNYVNRIVEKYPGAVVVTLALRSAGDTSRVDTESVTLQYMFEKFNIALPAKLNYGVGP